MAVSAPARVQSTRLLVGVVCAIIFFDALDLSITQIALPSIQRSLDVSTGTLPWIAAAYVVTYGGFLLLGGRAGDLLGARPVFLVGLAVFGASPLACGLAGNAGVLVAARAVQGIGAALTVPTAVVILAAAFTDERARTRAFGVFSAAAASGFTAGLVLGGLITSGLTWRWIFLAKVPAVAAALVVAVLTVPRTSRDDHRGGYDAVGAITITLTAILVTIGITSAGTAHPNPIRWAVPLLLAGLLLIVFVRTERRSRSPLLPPRLVTRPFMATNGAALTVLAAPFGVSFLATLYLQDVLGRTPWQTALTLVAGSVLSAIVSRYVAPSLLERWGLRRVYTGALLVVAAGDAILLALGPTNATWVVTVAALIAFGPGMGTAYPAAIVGGATDVAPADQGTAAGVTNTALQIGGGVGLAVVATAVGLGLPAGGTILGAGDPLTAFRYGTVAAVLLPLAGAATVWFGLRPSQKAGTVQFSSAPNDNTDR